MIGSRTGARELMRFIHGGSPMIRKTLAILLLANTLALAACNTIRGAGRDVESVANTVDKAT